MLDRESLTFLLGKVHRTRSPLSSSNPHTLTDHTYLAIVIPHNAYYIMLYLEFSFRNLPCYSEIFI